MCNTKNDKISEKIFKRKKARGLHSRRALRACKSDKGRLPKTVLSEVSFYGSYRSGRYISQRNHSKI